MPTEVSASLLRQRQTTVRYNWGFRFALWCAVLWALGYQGLDFLVHSNSFLGETFAGTNPFAVGLSIAVVFTAMLSLVSLIWVGANHGLRDWLRTVTQLARNNIILIVATVFGGTVALVSYVITFLMDSEFAVAMVMFYSIVGTLMAHLWYREKVSRRAVLGLIIIALGCLFLYLSVSRASASNHLAVLGMGIFGGLGWGIEGALAARAMDVVDSNIAMSVRFTFEAILWIAIFLLSLVFGQGQDVTTTTLHILSSPAAMLMLGLVALCIHFDYLCWYKSFIYCGVGLGLAVSSISSGFTVILGAALTTILPGFLSVIAFAFMTIGVFLVFSGQNSRLAALRDVELEPSSAVAFSVQGEGTLPLKACALVTIAELGRCWDYELAAKLVGEKDSLRTRHLHKKLRLYLIEAQAAGLIVALDEKVDDGRCFAKGKLLSNYALTVFGSHRLQAAGLITIDEPNVLHESTSRE